MTIYWKQSSKHIVIFNNKTKAMITPENQIPYDDADNSEADDQQSQKDIHASGLEDAPEAGDTVDFADTDKLKRAYDASESSFTLNLGDAPKPKKEKE
jgi:hypothetical protein